MLRCLLASGVAHECRMPGAATWELAAGQVEWADVRLAGVVVPLGKSGLASNQLSRVIVSDCSRLN